MFSKPILTILACAIFFCNFSMVHAAEVKGTILSVSGNGNVLYPPDTAILSLGVETFAKNSTEAQEENDRRANSLYNFLTRFGIAKEDIKTDRYWFSPVHSQKENEYNKIIGYRVENTLTIKLRDTNAVGKVIELALKNGANRVDSLTFTLENMSKGEQEALMEASKNARLKAEVIAKSLGKTIVGIESVKEETDMYSRPIYYEQNFALRSDTKKSSSAPIESGTLKFMATLHVNFILNND